MQLNVPCSHGHSSAFPLAWSHGLGGAGAPEHLQRAQKEPIFPDAVQCPGHITQPMFRHSQHGPPLENQLLGRSKNPAKQVEKRSCTEQTHLETFFTLLGCMGGRWPVCRKTCVYSGSTSQILSGVFMLSHWVCLSLFGSGGPLPDSFVKPKPKSSLIPGPDMLFGSSDFYLVTQGNPRANVHLKMSFCPDSFFCPGSWLLHLWRRCSATNVSCAQTGRIHGA